MKPVNPTMDKFWRAQNRSSFPVLAVYGSVLAAVAGLAAAYAVISISTQWEKAAFPFEITGIEKVNERGRSAQKMHTVRLSGKNLCTGDVIEDHIYVFFKASADVELVEGLVVHVKGSVREFPFGVHKEWDTKKITELNGELNCAP